MITDLQFYFTSRDKKTTTTWNQQTWRIYATLLEESHAGIPIAYFIVPRLRDCGNMMSAEENLDIDLGLDDAVSVGHYTSNNMESPELESVSPPVTPMFTRNVIQTDDIVGRHSIENTDEDKVIETGSLSSGSLFLISPLSLNIYFLPVIVFSEKGFYQLLCFWILLGYS